jgi:probable H4MPT-linked C1 transfer pathway protein
MDPKPAPDRPSRPTVVDYFFILFGFSLSLYLCRLDPLPVRPADAVQDARVRPLIPLLSDLMRLPEGAVLMWPVFLALQRVLGRKRGLTSVEWLWVLSWLGVAVLTGLSVGSAFDLYRDPTLRGWVESAPRLWYAVLVPSIAGLALLLWLIGLFARTPPPWTHTFGLALLAWPVLPLAGVLTLGQFAPKHPPPPQPEPAAVSRTVLGLDVGGANLKAAHTAGAARSAPFALWKDPAGLPAALRALIASMPPADALAVTMTGELCDCFESKRQGVSAILDAVEAAAGPTPVRVWRTDGRFVDPASARATPLLTAAGNWLALATLAGRYAPRGPALLIDVGSTTTDVVPLRDGRPAPQGRTDPERLRGEELVYVGVRRTPLCAVLGLEAAAELFATTLDACLLLGAIPPDAADRNTADGRPATAAAAHARIARMLCADLETSTPEQRMELARRVVFKQVFRLTEAVERVAARLGGPPAEVLLAGEGEFLARTVLKEQRAFPPCATISLAAKLGAAASRAACAYAVAVLAAEG